MQRGWPLELRPHLPLFYHPLTVGDCGTGWNDTLCKLKYPAIHRPKCHCAHHKSHTYYAGITFGSRGESPPTTLCVCVCVRACVCVCVWCVRDPWTGLSVRTVSGRDLRASPRGSRKKPKLGHLKDDEQTFFCDSLEGVLRNLKKLSLVFRTHVGRKGR